MSFPYPLGYDELPEQEKQQLYNEIKQRGRLTNETYDYYNDRFDKRQKVHNHNNYNSQNYISITYDNKRVNLSVNGIVQGGRGVEEVGGGGGNNISTINHSMTSNVNMPMPQPTTTTAVATTGSSITTTTTSNNNDNMNNIMNNGNHISPTRSLSPDVAEFASRFFEEDAIEPLPISTTIAAATTTATASTLKPSTSIATIDSITNFANDIENRNQQNNLFESEVMNLFQNSDNNHKEREDNNKNDDDDIIEVVTKPNYSNGSKSTTPNNYNPQQQQQLISNSSATKASSSSISSSSYKNLSEELSKMEFSITSLSQETLNAHDIISKVVHRCQEVESRFLPCVDFLVSCQQELRHGLTYALQQKSRKSVGRRYTTLHVSYMYFVCSFVILY